MIFTVETDIKLFATDLDGTLLNNKGIISSYNLSALQRLHDSGVIIVIATGRPFHSVSSLFGNNLHSIVDYAICMNGADIYNCNTNSHLYHADFLSAVQIKELIRIGNKDNAAFIQLSNSQYSVNYCRRSHAIYLFFYNIARYFYHKMIHKHHTPAERYTSSIRRLINQHFDKICFAGDYDSLHRIYDALYNKSDYSVFFVSHTWLEVMDTGSNKGTGLAYIQKITSINSLHTASIGDGENDLSMFAVSGTKIAMRNAMEAVKDASNYVTDSNFNNGVGKWIEKYLL